MEIKDKDGDTLALEPAVCGDDHFLLQVNAEGIYISVDQLEQLAAHAKKADAQTFRSPGDINGNYVEASKKNGYIYVGTGNDESFGLPAFIKIRELENLIAWAKEQELV